MVSSEYTHRINMAIDYIERNLAKPLTLDEIASAACFSPYHFHRLFSGLVGETLNNFVKRIRIERAAMLLRRNAKMSITQVAFTYGFASSQTFSRAFRERFGMTPSAFRHSKCGHRKNCNENSNRCNTDDKICKAFREENSYKVGDDRPTSSFISSSFSMHITVKSMPAQHLAYVRHIGSYMENPQAIFGPMIQKICTRAGPRNLLGPDSTFVFIYHDDPNITEHEKLRTDIGLPVPEKTSASGEINIQTLPHCQCAVARCELKEHKEFDNARQEIYCNRLPTSGYQPDNYPPYEIYYGDPKTHPQGKFVLDICIPVKPL